MQTPTQYKVEKWDGATTLPPLLLGDPGSGLTLDLVEKSDTWDVYVGYVNDKPKGYFIITAPLLDQCSQVCLNAIHWRPFLPMIFNTGGPKLLRMMLQTIGKVCKDNGWPAVMATNHSDYSNEAWTEKFKDIGTIKKVCTVFEFSEFPDS
jgi:hypothetical protein